jgi:hypothetical protein
LVEHPKGAKSHRRQEKDYLRPRDSQAGQA